jgi:hypothetical protein
MTEPDKRVDEGYRRRVEEEKKRADERGERKLPEADFLTLVASLAGQATINLGLVEHPLAKKVRKDLNQARYTIDLLAILEAKTRGNLNDEERAVLSNVLTDLRMRYVQAGKASGG